MLTFPKGVIDMIDKNKQRELLENDNSQSDNSEQEDNSQNNQKEEFFSEIRGERGTKEKESKEEQPDYGFEADMED